MPRPAGRGAALPLALAALWAAMLLLQLPRLAPAGRAATALTQSAATFRRPLIRSMTEGPSPRLPHASSRRPTRLSSASQPQPPPTPAAPAEPPPGGAARRPGFLFALLSPVAAAWAWVRGRRGNSREQQPPMAMATEEEGRGPWPGAPTFRYQELQVPTPGPGPPAQAAGDRMDVTKHNFPAVAAELEALLEKCDFVAFDEEMTGISLPDRRPNPANSPGENYALQRAVAERYAIIQIGVCPFLKDPTVSGQWVAYPFNFFVFPDSGGKDVVMSAPAIAFNRQHGMDFQKWIYQGVPYVSAATEDALREKTWPTPKAPETPETGNGEERPAKRQKLQKEGDQLWFQAEWTKFEAWVAAPFVEGREFQIMENGPVRRKYFEAQVQSQHPGLLLESRLKNPGSGSWARNYFVVQRSEKSRREREEREQAQREADFHRKVGFRRIYKALAAARKPLVGHNLLFDLLFMMAAFEGDLPKQWEDWKTLTHERFPTIYDTKYLAQSKHLPEPFQTTALEPLYKALVAGPDAPTVQLPLGFEAYSPAVLASVKKDGSAGGSRAHEAAYDALMTGIAFLALRQRLQGHEDSLVNRANLMHSLYELNFAGADPLANGTGAVLHLTFESVLDTAAVLNSFGELPGTVSWIDDTSAFACMAPEVSLDAAVVQLRSQNIFKTVKTLEEFRLTRGL